jgi:hypothetical protein
LTYASVDKLQNMLATEVFGYAKDKKKASLPTEARAGVYPPATLDFGGLTPVSNER